MKKYFRKCITTFVLCILSSFAFSAMPGDTIYVAVKESCLKTGTGSFDKTVKKLQYGEELYVKEATGKWYKVETTGTDKVQGWIPVSSVTSRKVVTGSKKVSASANEIALAGKGFNAQVENEYKQTNASLDYASVDKMEAFVLSDSELEKFIIDGQLNGAAQ